MRLNEAQIAKCVAIRNIMDKVVKAIPAGSEAEFNASAATINEYAAAIRVWRADVDYARGALAVDPIDDVPYWALHDHGPTTGQVHQPSESPTMWAHCHGTSKETARPFVAESYNPYNDGHYCVEDGVVYRCKANNTIYAPSVYPQAWELAV